VTSDRATTFRLTSPGSGSTQCTWNTRFAKSSPYVVTLVAAPLSLEWLCDNSTLAHRRRSGSRGVRLRPLRHHCTALG
jgi:hypothetical protein